jgi:WD40 repeat protein
VFAHPDIVASVAFKSGCENYFASGCFDKLLRIWNIKQRKVVEWQQTPNYITALCFTPSTGDRLAVGLITGEILIYDLNQEKLKLLMQVNTKQSLFSS